MKHKFLLFLSIFVLSGFVACKKDHDTTPQEQKTVGMYVQFEGVSGQKNSGIAWYNFETNQSDPNYFKTVNGYDLGETASDLELYGSKLYCVISGTQGAKESYVEVINPTTGKSIKRISFNGETSGYLPRAIAFAGSKAYVSAYDGKIRRIDTASLTIDDNELEAGGAMEGIAIAHNKIYVANSQHFLYPDATSKNTISVIDIPSFKKVKEISVVANPQKVVATETGSILVVSWGNYADIQPAWQSINPATDEVTATYSDNIASIATNGTLGYVVTDLYSTPSIKSLNLTSNQIAGNFITDNTAVGMPYGLSINPLNGDVFIGDAISYTSTKGEALCFSSTGKLSVKFETGANPSHAVFIHAYK